MSGAYSTNATELAARPSPDHFTSFTFHTLYPSFTPTQADKDPSSAGNTTIWIYIYQELKRPHSGNNHEVDV